MRVLISFAFALLLFSCKQEPRFDPTLIQGEWKGADWTVKGKSAGRDVREVRFAFEPAGAYVAEYGEQKEAGNFRIDGDKLYTVAENKIEKVVRIVRLTADTLVMDMNRVGQDGQLILVKK